MSSEPCQIRRLKGGDADLARDLNALFADVFAEPETYAGRPPTREYLSEQLARDHIIALIAIADERVVGGLVAYELDKLEQARREIYIYDLAVAKSHRRQGIATALIGEAREIAARRGAWVVYVQADYVDPPAIALYEKLGRCEEVLHFDIPVD